MVTTRTSDFANVRNALTQQGATIALFSAQAVLSARWLGPSGKGLLTITMQLGTLLGAAILLGLPLSVAAHVSRGTIQGRQVLGALVVLIGLGALGSLAVSFAAAGHVPSSFRFGVGILPLAVPILGSLSLVTYAGYAAGDSRSPLIGQVLANAVLASAYLMFWGLSVPADFRLAVGAWLVSYLTGGVACMVLMRRFLSEGPFWIGAGTLRSLFSTGGRAVFGQLASLLNMRLDVLILGLVAGAKPVGIYSVAVSVVLIPQVVPQAIALALTRSFGQNTYPGSSVARVLRLSLVLAVMTGVAMIILAWVAVTPVFGERFASVAALVSVMAIPSAVFGTVAIGSQYALHNLKRPAYQSIVVGLTLALDMIVLALLVRPYGAWGAAIASSIAYVVGGTINLKQMCQWTESNIGEIVLPHAHDFGWLRQQAMLLLGGRPAGEA